MDMEISDKRLDVNDSNQFSAFDLKAFLVEVFKDLYETTRSRSMPKSDSRKLIFNLDFQDVMVTHEDPVYNMGDIIKIPQGKSIFSTSFTNNTDSEQNYEIHVERTTVSTAEIELTSGHTTVMEVGMELKIPGDILTANVGFSKELNLECTKTQSVDQEINWGVNANIKVKPGHKVTAHAIVKEEKRECKFTMRTKLQGTIRCVYTDASKENRFVQMTEGKIGNLFQRHLGLAKKMAGGVLIVTEKVNDTTIVTMETRGRIQFRYGVQQDVTVTQDKL
ncbi:hypothetical protein Ciccas_005298 [Cichlidogyrus casuarinus]|uniref:Adhesin domain-containing protein n=1 Tax=Cichlidogyrus casuarinus TaxID=1844966 RepID=A0ABD2QA00_9PLAT